MATTRVTVELPTDLLDRACQSTSVGITATIRRGLELVASAGAQKRLAALRGKVKLSLDLNASRRGHRL